LSLEQRVASRIGPVTQQLKRLIVEDGMARIEEDCVRGIRRVELEIRSVPTPPAGAAVGTSSSVRGPPSGAPASPDEGQPGAPEQYLAEVIGGQNVTWAVTFAGSGFGQW
jgi:hypothetical protein